ncbi:MAG: hypothetical protein GWP75_11140 [Planctomycetia bacterium]|jgi:hypothetical protein|nr:hypothetical protein [Planctomycetia bacterium]
MNIEDQPLPEGVPDVDRVAEDAASIPTELVDLDARLAVAMRHEREVAPDRAASLASSVFSASVGSLPSGGLPVTTYPIVNWRRRLAAGVGLAAAASLAIAAWIEFQSTPTPTRSDEAPRIAATEHDAGVESPAEFEFGFEGFGDGGTLLVSIDSPTGPEALLAAVMMGGDAEWLDDAPSATLAVQNVRPVLDSWSIDVTDVEAEIQSIIAGPTS